MKRSFCDAHWKKFLDAPCHERNPLGISIKLIKIPSQDDQNPSQDEQDPSQDDQYSSQDDQDPGQSNSDS